MRKKFDYKFEFRHCPLCLSDDIEVVFGHDCPYDPSKLDNGAMFPGVNIDAKERGNGSGKGSGGNSPPKASPKQIAYAIALGLPEHIANAMTAASARDHIPRLLEERKRKGVDAPVSGASPKQIDFITSLLRDRPGAWDGDVNTLSSSDASALIKRLLATPKSQAPKVATEIVTDGFYVDDSDVIYKVQRAVHGSGNLYAKVLDTDTGVFEYAQGAIRTLGTMVSKGTAHKLTLERAKALGHLYGRCIICGKTLTDETSIANGIGPVCAKRF